MSGFSKDLTCWIIVDLRLRNYNSIHFLYSIHSFFNLCLRPGVHLFFKWPCCVFNFWIARSPAREMPGHFISLLAGDTVEEFVAWDCWLSAHMQYVHCWLVESQPGWWLSMSCSGFSSKTLFLICPIAISIYLNLFTFSVDKVFVWFAKLYIKMTHPFILINYHLPIVIFDLWKGVMLKDMQKENDILILQYESRL